LVGLKETGMEVNMRIGIIGRTKDTKNYEKYFAGIPAEPLTTLSLGTLPSFDWVVLPGGGDITPAFFGERDYGSRNIDTELDILQFQALDYCIKHKVPVMGICKGMQVINVAFGGTIHQDLPTASIHQYMGADQYHASKVVKGTFLHDLYGEDVIINSAHHQGLKSLGKNLCVIQWCPEDRCVEGIAHTSLPILGLQWHPERLQKDKTTITGDPLLSYFASLASSVLR